MSPREKILAAIRRSLERGMLSDSETAALEQGLNRPQRNTVPQRGQTSQDRRLEQFADRARAETATVSILNHLSEVPRAVGDFLDRHQLPHRAVIAPHADLSGLDWQGMETRTGPARRDDLVGVTPAFAAVAETGTLCMASGPDHPGTLNLLPDNHIAVVRGERILGCYEDCWDLLRREYGSRIMPRTLLWITGPSMTGDIEQTLMRGAHGPRRLHILVVPGTVIPVQPAL